MKKKVLASLMVALLAGATAVAARGPGSSLLEFTGMVGVSGPYVGTANPIRGVAGGGLPWTIDGAKAELKSDGRLEVNVRGLVLVTTSANPLPVFRAVLSCQSIDSVGNPTVVNVSTGDVPATTTGDADIEARLTLPSTCFAPIVFVTTSTGRWLAVSGF